VSAAAARHGQITVSVSHYTNFRRPMTAGRTGATATAIHQSRTRQLWQAGPTTAGRRLITTGQVRLQNAGPRP